MRVSAWIKLQTDSDSNAEIGNGTDMVEMSPFRRAQKSDQTAGGASLDRNQELQSLVQRLSEIAAVPRKSAMHLNQNELADRWRMSPRTLERWRWLKMGPRYIKVGGRVIYCVDDVKAYEARQGRG
jgi:hypothetical protein